MNIKKSERRNTVIRIENWEFIEWQVRRHKPAVKRIKGIVYNHPSFKDGELIVTSPVVKLDFGLGIAKTRNTRYILGKLNHEFEKSLKSKIIA